MIKFRPVRFFRSEFRQDIFGDGAAALGWTILTDYTSYDLGADITINAFDSTGPVPPPLTSGYMNVSLTQNGEVTFYNPAGWGDANAVEFYLAGDIRNLVVAPRSVGRSTVNYFLSVHNNWAPICEDVQSDDPYGQPPFTTFHRCVMDLAQFDALPASQWDSLAIRHSGIEVNSTFFIDKVSLGY
ncbi:hypothetical protein HK097_007760, partial [Rhizophlyctis rosea]